LQPNDRRRLRRPSIAPVLWDNFFASAKAQATAKQLITDLVQGPFMNALVQYGIGDGVLANTIVLDTTTHPAPGNWDNGSDDDKNQVLQWVNDGTISPKPVVDESSLVFFFFLPTTTTITNGKNKMDRPTQIFAAGTKVKSSTETPRTTTSSGGWCEQTGPISRAS
jgi:hypothetical protein